MQIRLVLVYSEPGDRRIHKIHLHVKVFLKTWNSEFSCKFSKVFQEADTDNIVGFALVQPQHSILVYDSGEIRNQYLQSTTTKSMLTHSLGKIKCCQFTSYSHPRLVLQGDDLSIAVFDYVNNWTQQIVLKDVQFGLLNAFGNFLVTQQYGQKGIKLLELQSQLENPITTVLPLSSSNKASYVDSCLLDKMSYLRYTKNGTDFDFKKINQQRCIFHTAKGFLDYACGDFIFSLAQDCSYILLEKNLVNIQNQFTSEQLILMPELPVKSVKSFKVYQCLNSKNYLIAIQPNIQSGDFTTQKQYLVFCNVMKNRILQVNCPSHQLPFTTILFRKKRMVICQNATWITEYFLREKESCFELEEVKGSIMLDLGRSRFRVFQYLEHQGEETLLLTQDKLLIKSDEKIIYQIQLNKVRIKQTQSVKNQDSIDINKFIEVAFVLSTKLSFTDEAFSAKSEQRVLACYCPKTDSGFALVASADFALLYKLKYTGTAKVRVSCCQALTIRNADQLLIINSEQIAISSNIDVIVVNHSTWTPEEAVRKIQPKILVHEIDFKIFFKSRIQHVSVSHNIMAVQYGSSSFLMLVGEPAKSAPKSTLEVMQTKISSFNMVSASFKRCLKEYGLDGYISVQEQGGRWQEEAPYTIINVHSADLLTIKTTQAFFSGDQSFDETILVQNAYLNKFTIWEGIIRDALADRRVDVTQFQLPRVLRPVLGDYNRNLIHHLSSNQHDLLEQILSMPEVEQYYSQYLTKTPIFFNFFGQNQMQLALEARDNESFYMLMELMLEHQNNVLNSYLVNPFLIKVLEQGFDVSKLLDSNICSYKLEQVGIEHIQSFASVHQDEATVIVNYEGTLIELSHDENAYDNMFGKRFPFLREQNQNLGQKKTHQANNLAIEYIAYRYPIGYDKMNLKENSKEVHHLLEILASTDQTSYLRTAYVQRLIDYQWNGKLKKAYSIILGFTLTEFALILISSSCLNVSDDKIGSDVRVSLSLLNAILIILSVGAFELRQLVTSGLKYFKSLWNINDFMLFCLAMAVPVIEILYNIYLGDQYELASEEATTDDAIIESTLRFLKPKKRPKGGKSKTVVTDAGPIEIEVEDTLLQVLRICYVCLILMGFFKVLYVAQIYPNVGYLLKMLSKICRASVPFLMFFLYLNLAFTCVMEVIHISFDETASRVFMGEYQGYNLQVMAYIMYTIRQSLGDTKVDTFLFLPKPLMYIAWVMWFLLFSLNSMIFLNFLIATIEEQYNDTKINRVEESYRSKASILLDLDDVFGSYIVFRPVNILVLRQGVERPERSEANEMLASLKAQMIQQQTILNTAMQHVKRNITNLKCENHESHKKALKEFASLCNYLDTDSPQPILPQDIKGATNAKSAFALQICEEVEDFSSSESISEEESQD